MKDKFLLFIIGVLVGAIISTGAFFAYTKATTACNNSNNQMRMPGGNPPSMQDRQSGQQLEKPGENIPENNSETNNN